MTMNRPAACALAGITIVSMLPLFSVLAAPANDADTCLRASGDAAIAACTRAVGSGLYKGHSLAVLYNNRGFEWYAKGDYDHAVADYTEAIRLDPQYTHAYIGRGLTWYNTGDYHRAIPDYNEAIQLNPNLALAYYDRGLA